VTAPPPRSVGIAGTGLLGASIGLRSRSLGSDVQGWDLDPEHAQAALAVGALDRVAAGFEELAARSDVLVIAAPLDATLGLIDRLRACAPPSRLILDVASLKVPVVERARGLDRFFATHPIAGSERSGARAAAAGLFEDAIWTFVPSGEPEGPLLDFIAAMGARPMAVDAQEHDRTLAVTSHLPQILGTAFAQNLGARLGDPLVRALCGPGAASSARLGGSPWSMWSSLLGGPAGRAAAQEVRNLCDVLAQAATELESGAADALEARFAAANAAVERLRANAEADSRVFDPAARSIEEV
jgi:prephenate dehydrogenase